MHASAERIDGAFQPIKLTIVIESREELRDVMDRFRLTDWRDSLVRAGGGRKMVLRPDERQKVWWALNAAAPEDMRDWRPESPQEARRE